jgi:hypothetical protein
MVGLHQSLDGIAAANQLATNGVFIALDRSIFEKLSSAMTLRSVSLRSKKLGDDIDVMVDSMSVSPEAGRMAVTLDVTAKSTERGLTAGLRVDGFIYFAGITEEHNPSDNAPINAANFKFLPVSLAPHLQYGFLSLRARKFVNGMITAGVFSLLFDRLAWKIAYRPSLAFSYDSSSAITQHFGQDNSGTLVLRVTPSPLHFQRWLKILAPVFTTHGVLLAASLDQAYQPPALIPPPVSRPGTPQDVDATENQVETKAAALGGYFSKNVAVTLGRSALDTLSGQLAAVLDGFTIAARGQSFSGRLFDKPWRDKILGDGGFFAEVRDASRIEATAKFAKPSATLDPSVGPRLVLPVGVSFDAPLHVHVDPLIGGGVGTTIGIKGAANTTLTAWMGTTKFVFEGQPIALAGPVMTCALINIDAKSDGKFTLGTGWATVPQIGAKFGQLIGQSPLAPTIVAGPPINMAILAPTPRAERASVDLVVLQGLFATITLDDFSADVTSQGYRLSTSFKITLASQSLPQPTDDYRNRLRTAAADFWSASMRQPCPDVPAIRIEVGDIEIGPNGEILKFLKNAWNDITKGPGKNNEVVKLLGRIQAAAGSYDDATKKLASDLGAMAQAAFPHDSAVGHAAGEAVKSVTKATTNPVGAVRDFGHQLLHGFK